MNEELKNLLAKVRELYIKYGIKSITMDDIARELGISKKTIYQYVTDKDDLVGKFIDNEISLRKEEICKCFKVGYNAIEELFGISLYMNKLMRNQSLATEYDLKKYYPTHYHRAQIAKREGVHNFILMNLKKGIQEKLYREDLNTEVIARLYLWRTENMQSNEVFSVEEFTSLKLFIEMLNYHIRGIATEKGISILEKKISELENANIK